MNVPLAIVRTLVYCRATVILQLCSAAQNAVGYYCSGSYDSTEGLLYLQYQFWNVWNVCIYCVSYSTPVAESYSASGIATVLL